MKFKKLPDTVIVAILGSLAIVALIVLGIPKPVGSWLGYAVGGVWWHHSGNAPSA
jgi:hypothetical protein